MKNVYIRSLEGEKSWQPADSSQTTSPSPLRVWQIEACSAFYGWLPFETFKVGQPITKFSLMKNLLKVLFPSLVQNVISRDLQTYICHLMQNSCCPQTSAPSMPPPLVISLHPMVQNSTPLIDIGTRHALLFLTRPLLSDFDVMMKWFCWKTLECYSRVCRYFVSLTLINQIT